MLLLLTFLVNCTYFNNKDCNKSKPKLNYAFNQYTTKLLNELFN